MCARSSPARSLVLTWAAIAFAQTQIAPAGATSEKLPESLRAVSLERGRVRDGRFCPQCALTVAGTLPILPASSPRGNSQQRRACDDDQAENERQTSVGRGTPM